MSKQITPNRRVLIASSHPLFGQGLRNLLKEHREAGVEIVGMVSSLDQVLKAIEKFSPDLVIVDYDDEELNRDEFLARFVESEKKMRLVLVSLQSGQDALIYDRHTLAASQVTDWLEMRPQTARGNRSRSKSMKHFIIAGILVIVVTAGLIFGMNFIRLLPEQASAQAVPIDRLFRIEFSVIAFLFSLIVVMMIYSVVVFRRKPGDTSDARHIEGNNRLEVVWTIAPLITVMAFAVMGGRALSDTMRADPRPLEINVIGQQWTWRFEYPQYGIVTDTMFLLENKQAILHMSSIDVIHSFWVPEFRVKQDALPGGEAFVRDLRVTPTRLGEFKVRCAEMCGLKHATMESPVIVVSKQDFDAWVAQQTGESTDPVVRGQKAAKTYGCLTCHSVDGSKLVGPTWKGLYGSQVTMTDGTTVTADEAYLIESILDPGRMVVEGFPAGTMLTTYRQQLTNEIIADIIAFIESLK